MMIRAVYIGVGLVLIWGVPHAQPTGFGGCFQRYPQSCVDAGYPDGYLPAHPEWCPYADSAVSTCANHLICCPIIWDCDMQMFAAEPRVTVFGSVMDSYNIVFIGDGFQGTIFTSGFGQKVSEAKQVILSTPPFSDFECAFNFYEVEVSSADTQIDEPYNGLCFNTQFNTGFGALGDPTTTEDDEPEHIIVAWQQERCFRAAGFVGTSYDLVVVLVNSNKEAGSADRTGDTPIIFLSLGGDWQRMLAHELGHAIGDLAEEYDCYCCGNCADNTIDNTVYGDYAGADPVEPNITSAPNPANVKWEAMLTEPVPPIPTDPAGPFTVPEADAVGLFVGAGTYKRGLYRSQLNCIMKDLTVGAFCQVCDAAIRNNLHCGPVKLFTRESLHMKESMFSRGRETFRWPIPRWSGMYDQDADTVYVALETDLELQRVARMIRVVDIRGNVIAQGKVGADAAVVSFIPDPYEPHFLELETQKSFSDRVTFTASMRVNGVDMSLPE